MGTSIERDIQLKINNIRLIGYSRKGVESMRYRLLRVRFPEVSERGYLIPDRHGIHCAMLGDLQ